MIRIMKVTNRIWANANNAQRLSASVMRFSTSDVKGNTFVFNRLIFYASQ